MSVALVWLRDGLRLDDQLPLLDVARTARHLIVVAFDELGNARPTEYGHPRTGGFRQAFRRRSAATLDAALQPLGQRLLWLRQDPDGAFVRRWIPELEGVAGDWIFEPWRMSETDRRRTGASDYPRPIVDHSAAARLAKQRVTEYRRRPGFRAEAERVRKTLGSRRPG